MTHLKKKIARNKMYLEKTKLERQKNREQKANPTTYESSESISEGKIVD